MEFLPIAILLIFAIVLSLGIFVLTTVLGPKNPLASKLSTYECGVKAEGDARHPFRSGFYLIAVFFLLMDVEAAFLFPWALIYRESLGTGPALLLAMLFYVGLMVLGLFYIYRKNVLRLR